MEEHCLKKLLFLSNLQNLNRYCHTDIAGMTFCSTHTAETSKNEKYLQQEMNKIHKDIQNTTTKNSHS